MKKKRILAAASIGGHWIELLKITNVLTDHIDIIYLSTHQKSKSIIGDEPFYTILDFSRWDFYKLFPAFIQALYYIGKEKPDVVISTGAAPGLIALFAGKILGKKTIWIDSIANMEEISLSGKIASKFVSRMYVQWENQSKGKYFYAGNVLD